MEDDWVDSGSLENDLTDQEAPQNSYFDRGSRPHANQDHSSPYNLLLSSTKQPYEAILINFCGHRKQKSGCNIVAKSNISSRANCIVLIQGFLILRILVLFITIFTYFINICFFSIKFECSIIICSSSFLWSIISSDGFLMVILRYLSFPFFSLFIIKNSFIS